MSISRRWLALVVALFCLPLFVDLGRADVQDDEAIYSFGVDRLLESGDWLAPKSSPHEDAAFLEKPPLKFWIVGLPIQFGLLPHNEFGLRFWDALFGGLAFLYVFAVGSRLAGPVCGGVAVLILFVHFPLLFDHGLRTNNMEAALFLSYCGGLFHVLEWGRLTSGADRARPDAATAGGRHAVAAGLYFVLGFMTKFVAAAFLPLVAGAAVLLLPAYRAALWREWRVWAKVGALIVALAAPWFVYAHLRFGSDLWQVILGEHVYTRFTAYLDPEHLHPWYYYPSEMYQRFTDSGAEVLVIGGLLLLTVQAIRRRSFDGTVILLWLLVPPFLISLGTSKLYHYAYPFLPPLALAGGYLASFILALAPVPLSRAWLALDAFADKTMPRFVAAFRRPAVRALCLTLAVASIAVAVVTLVVGPIRITMRGTDVFRSSGVFRPSVSAILFGVLAGAGHGASRAVVAVLVASMLPLPAYRVSLTRLGAGQAPKRDASDCVRRVEAALPPPARGLYLDLPDRAIGHPLNYYFRRVRPWTRPAESSAASLERYLYDPAERRPILVWGPTYQAFRRGPGPAAAHVPSPAMVAFDHDVLLLLPGPYAVCGADAAVGGETR